MKLIEPLATTGNEAAHDPRTMTPTVFVLDDDAAIRKSIRWLVESIHFPVEEFSSADDFLAKVGAHRAGCLLLDVRMPGMGGLELQEHLVEQHFAMPVVIITGHADVPMAVKALQAGAFDLIEKPFSDKRLIETVDRAMAKDREQRALAEECLGIQERMARLTPRERQVMEMVITGSSNKDMAAALEVTSKTIEAHRSKVMSKMEADSVAELVRMCLTAREFAS